MAKASDDSSGKGGKGGGGSIGPLALMMTGLGSLIGSGWLFGPWHTSEMAGPGAVGSWIVAAVMIAVIAATFTELGSMFPESGGIVRYGFYTHGALLGFIAAWANWVAIVTTMPVEAEATVQYMATWPFKWAHGLYANERLNPFGLLIAAACMIGYFLLNYFGVKLYVRFNSALTPFKIIVPFLTAVAILIVGFHPQNFAIGAHPGGPPIAPSTVLAAAATSGIIFSLNGFQTPINLAGDAKDPGKSLPLAVFGSLLIAVVLYVTLQVAFVGGTPQKMLGQGWGKISFSSPFAELATAVNLNWLAMILYVDAFVSPTGTGATYTASTARIVGAVQRSGALPKRLGQTDERSGAPRPAMWLNLLVGFAFLVSFPGWSALAAVISVACILSYLAGPVGVATLRRTAPDLERPFRLPAMRVFTGTAFVFATLLLYWAKWPTTGEVIIIILISTPLYLWAEVKHRWRDWRRQLKGAAWLLAYMPAMALVSLVGSREFGGLGLIPFGPDLVVAALAGLGFYLWGVRSGWRTPAIERRTKGEEDDGEDSGDMF
jgi:amino acid transporter